MTVENEAMVRKMFYKVLGICRDGKYSDDPEKNMGIPYEFEAGGEINKINDQIYDLRRKMAEEYTGNKNCDTDDYRDLWDLDCLYFRLTQEFCYKMFVYGFALGSDEKSATNVIGDN